MQVIPHNPVDGVYPASGDYAHAIEVRGPERLLFVAGTLGLDPQGAPGAAIVAQTLVSDWLVEIEVIAAA